MTTQEILDLIKEEKLTFAAATIGASDLANEGGSTVVFAVKDPNTKGRGKILTAKLGDKESIATLLGIAMENGQIDLDGLKTYVQSKDVSDVKPQFADAMYVGVSNSTNAGDNRSIATVQCSDGHTYSVPHDSGSVIEPGHTIERKDYKTIGWAACSKFAAIANGRPEDDIMLVLKPGFTIRGAVAKKSDSIIARNMINAAKTATAVAAPK